jgi:hypothetical protein
MDMVKADKYFNCSAYTFINPLYGSWPYIDSVYGVKNICRSDNEIEIRLTACYSPTSMFDIVILSLKDDQWAAKKFQFYIKDYLDVDSARNTDSGRVLVSALKAKEGFGVLSGKLKENNVFSLPDLKEINNKPQGPVCGLMYSLTFKVGNNYRTYTFSNPEYYIEHSDRKIFRNYYNIAEILFKELVKE